MIVTLKSWSEIGAANKELARRGLPRHQSPEKNWDLNLLQRSLEGVRADALIVDLGCGDCYALKYLAATGFRNLLGIDLTISVKSRAGAWKRRLTGKPSFALRRADILSTGLSDEVADVAISVSVVEHGVDLPRFFKEVGRILRNNGRLYMTTDYWPTPIHIPDEPIAFGRSWQPFNRESLLALVDVAQSFGFRLCGPEFDLETEERCVVWAGREYTFVAMQFVKDSRS